MTISNSGLPHSPHTGREDDRFMPAQEVSGDVSVNATVKARQQRHKECPLRCDYVQT